MLMLLATRMNEEYKIINERHVTETPGDYDVALACVSNGVDGFVFYAGKPKTRSQNDVHLPDDE